MKTGEIKNCEGFDVGSGADIVLPSSLALSTITSIPQELRPCQGISVSGAADGNWPLTSAWSSYLLRWAEWRG